MASFHSKFMVYYEFEHQNSLNIIDLTIHYSLGRETENSNSKCDNPKIFGIPTLISEIAIASFDMLPLSCSHSLGMN